MFLLLAHFCLLLWVREIIEKQQCLMSIMLLEHDCHGSHQSAGSSMSCKCKGNEIFRSSESPQGPLGSGDWLIGSDPLNFSIWNKSWNLLLVDSPCPNKPSSCAGSLKGDTSYLAHSPVGTQKLHPGPLNGRSTGFPISPTLVLFLTLLQSAFPFRLLQVTSGHQCLCIGNCSTCGKCSPAPTWKSQWV